MGTKQKAGRAARPRAAPRVTKAGRERMQLLVDPALLAAAGAALGTTTKSDAVNAALRNAAENAAILRGVDAALGTIPDFPYLDT
jgi:Arc/MetJ family transcription regulator